jgi:hypothetical protein
MRNRAVICFLTILFFFSVSASGQKLVDSPISRFNLGILEPAGSFRSIGMGGVGTAIREGGSIYYLNPASYSAIDTNSFIFDFGMDYGLNVITDGSAHHTSDDMNFDHLMMGFPITKNFGVGVGILPYSNGYYSIAETIAAGDPGYDEVTGPYTTFHMGTGNLNTVFLGTGINLMKYLSAGVNMNILYGTLTRTNEFVFNDYSNSYHNDLSETSRLFGIGLDYGLQFMAPLKKNFFFNAGISYSSGKHCNYDYRYLLTRFTSLNVTDTLSFKENDSTKAYLPGTFRAGISFGKKNKFTVGLDFVSTKWSKATFEGAGTYAANTRALLLGLEYTPEKYSNYNFFKRIDFRLGGHIEDNYLIYNGQQVKEWGVSGGFGMMLRKTPSKVNVFFDFTRKSLAATSLSHYENYFTMGASINFYNIWFVKHKYE